MAKRRRERWESGRRQLSSTTWEKDERKAGRAYLEAGLISEIALVVPEGAHGQSCEGMCVTTCTAKPPSAAAFQSMRLCEL